MLYSSSSSVSRRMAFTIYLCAFFGVVLGALLGYLRHPFLGATLSIVLFFFVIERVATSEPRPRVTPEGRFFITLGLLQDRTYGEPVRLDAIAHVMGVEQETLMPLIGRAEVKGEIAVDEENRLSLTDAGRKRYDRHVTPSLAAASEGDLSHLDSEKG